MGSREGDGVAWLEYEGCSGGAEFEWCRMEGVEGECGYACCAAGGADEGGGGGGCCGKEDVGGGYEDVGGVDG